MAVSAMFFWRGGLLGAEKDDENNEGARGKNRYSAARLIGDISEEKTGIRSSGR